MIPRPTSAKSRPTKHRVRSGTNISTVSRTSSSSSVNRHENSTTPNEASETDKTEFKEASDDMSGSDQQSYFHGSNVTLDSINKHSCADDGFNDEDDMLEFRLDYDGQPGVVKFNEDENDANSPVVIRRGVKESIVSTPDRYSPQVPEDSRAHTLPADELFGDQISKSVDTNPNLPSTSSHQHTLASAFSYMNNDHVQQQDETAPTEAEEQEWQDMKTVASYEVFDEKGKLIVHKGLETIGEDEDASPSANIGASKGYTRVTGDEDARSITSMDEKADYLFGEEELDRNPISQLQATKDMLTDSQRIAYVGLCKLVLMTMAKDLAQLHESKKTAKPLRNARDALSKLSQQMMIRLYAHMDLSPEEQIMIEQLSEHGLIPDDLTPSLIQSAKVKNPMAEHAQSHNDLANDNNDSDDRNNDENDNSDLLESNPTNFDVKRPDEIKDQDIIEIDIRWTLLCDLFLVLISDAVYDARSRTLLVKVAEALKITELEICQFEKKVTDALEIEEGSIQTWDEKEIMEDRRKKSLKKRYAYVGLATLGGGLVIGLSAGLLAPVIGAGLAAGFTTIGVTGTGGFLAGAGGAAVVTTTGAAVGARIGSKGMSRRMGHVSTFEFRPLHNNKRVNCIVTVSGWMSGKEDDVRLPFSTVDPVMGDLFSVLWEPEMLQSMGQTINILATEVLVQSIQQLLGQTVLTALMASLQLPMVLSKLGYLLDNPWNVSLARAWSSGLILADSLINRNLGVRPVTLVGFSLGARVIYSCLVELARRGAFGLVDSVYIFGAPLAFKKGQVALVRSVVSGRFVNGYSRKDWVLGYLFRATSGGLGKVAGLAPIEYPGIENFDNTELVDGHMGYRKSIPKLLSCVGFEVISEEFTEIEDPDPEQERERQRELKQELSEARKQMEEEASKNEAQRSKKNFFSWFKPKKKEWWERTEGGSQMGEAEIDQQKGDIMFDVEAIKNEVNQLDETKASKLDKTAEVPIAASNTKDDEPANDGDIYDPADDGHILSSKEFERELAEHEAEGGVGGITMTFDDDAFNDDDNSRKK